jgi:hypothetical protein
MNKPLPILGTALAICLIGLPTTNFQLDGA